MLNWEPEGVHLSMEHNTKAQPILVLRKVSEILNCFTVRDPELTLQRIIRETGFPSSTCQRLVQNLVREGFLDRDGDNYRIGIGMVRWAAPGTLGLNGVRLVQPILQRLRDETGESACYYLRDGVFRTIVAVAETRHVVMRPFMVGMVMPIYAGAPGKVFLAFDSAARAELEGNALTRFTAATPVTLAAIDAQIAEARRLGYFAAFGERHQDVGSISAPVFNHAGILAGALGLGFPTQRIGPEAVAVLGPLVAAAAAEASEALGCDPSLVGERLAGRS